MFLSWYRYETKLQYANEDYPNGVYGIDSLKEVEKDSVKKTRITTNVATQTTILYFYWKLLA